MINPKKELFQWGPVRGRIHYVDYFAIGTLKEYAKVYKIPWAECYNIFHNNYMTWINEDVAIKNSGEKNFKRWMLNNANRKKVEQRYNRIVKEIFSLISKFTGKYLSSLSDVEIKKVYNQWLKLYIEFWIHGAVPEICNWGGEKLVAEILNKKIKQSKKFNEYYELLTAPTQPSFYQEEEIKLLKILKYRKQAKVFNQKLGEHQQKYFWLVNNYYRTKILSFDYFKKRLKGIKSYSFKISQITKHLKGTINRKSQLIKKLRLEQKEKMIVKSFDYSICWQDKRKATIMQINHRLDLLLKEIARRTAYSFDELKSVLPFEIKAILNGRKISKPAIKKRNKYFVFSYDKKKMRYLEGQKAKAIVDRFTFAKKDVSEVKGLVVSKGRFVSGRVRVIRSFQQLSKFKKGEILVTPMTSPEYVVAMRKAKAIVTDGGGMTCHAAIVSRELKIPCIVNTKIATKVFKTGDLIEVNANHGLVKKVK